MKINSKLILISILLVAAFFRFYLLANVPPSASLDEVSIGWNAYSILQTGRDEFKSFLPILLRAYDDYRPALYVYFVLPFVKIFGLDVVSVRLPSVILSILSVLGTYLLVKEFFRKKISPVFNPEVIALCSAFLLAISPWHIYISRLGHEVNLGLSFLIFAVLFFLKRRIYLSSLFFILSFLSYQSEKIFIPLLLIGMFFIFKEEILSMKKKIFLPSVLSLILISPFLKATFEPNALIRFSGTNIFKANEARFIEQSKKLQEATSEGDLIGKIIYNRRLVSLQLFSEGYLSHFDPVWLFTNSSGGLHKIPNIGLLYVWEIPFILLGIYLLIKNNFYKKTKKLIFLWFLISPIPAALTTDTPHALRTFIFLPIWQIFSAIGLVGSVKIFEKYSKVLPYAFSIVVLFSLLYLYKQYFYVFPKEQSASFQFSLSQTIPFVLEKEGSYKKIVFANHDALFQSYMFFLFYSKYDPKLYQDQGGTISGGYSSIHKFSKYEFRNIHIPSELKGALYVINYNDLKNLKKESFKIVKILRDLNNEPRIAVVSK